MKTHCLNCLKINYVSSRGSENEIIDFLNWFNVQNYTHKLFVAGNHDWFFERNSQAYIDKLIPE